MSCTWRTCFAGSCAPRSSRSTPWRTGSSRSGSRASRPAGSSRCVSPAAYRPPSTAAGASRAPIRRGAASRSRRSARAGRSGSTPSDSTSPCTGRARGGSRGRPGVPTQTAGCGRRAGLARGGRVVTPTRHLGLDLGGTLLKWAVIESADRGWDRLAADLVPTRLDAGADGIVDQMEVAAAAAGAEWGPFDSVGLGIPGRYDAGGGRVTLTPNIPVRWEGIRVVDRLETVVRVPVHLVNDARAFTLAELRLGARRPDARRYDPGHRRWWGGGHLGKAVPWPR